MASSSSSNNGTTPPRFLQIDEIRSAEDADFEYFIHLAEDHEDGWIKKLDKEVTIWQKETGTSTIKMAKLHGVFPNISASTVFDTILDADYRKVWDDNMIEDQDLYKLDDWNDIGYYSFKCPGPVKNRDFVNQRSWRIYSDSQYVVFNHSVSIKEIPVKKKFIRGVSYVTGFLIKSTDNGVDMTYVTQTDLKGNIPSWIINLTVSKIAPSVYNKLYRACSQYEEWKSKNQPEFKPWRFPEQNKLMKVDPASLIDGRTDQAAVHQEEENIPDTEEGIHELADQIIER